MTKFYLLLLCGSIFFTSCKTASKAYEKGNYADAIELGVRKLQKDPSDWETKELIQNSYNYAVNDHEDKIRILNNSTSDSRFESIYREYLRLQDLYHTIRAYPEPARQIKVNDYSSHVETYRRKTAQVHIDKAEYWMKDSTKLSYREAYKEYNNALRYLHDDFNLRRKRDSVYDAAMTKVLIVPLQQNGGYSYASSGRMQNFQNDILRTLSNNINNEFVRFYSEWESRNKNIVPDQVLELNLGRISIGQAHDNRNVREVSKEVVIKEIVHKPDSITKQYGTVTARITTTQRTQRSEGDLYINLRDNKGKHIWSDRFTGEHRWQTEFATYTGDERALSDADKNLLNKNTNYDPPTEERIVEELFKQIQNDLSSRLRSYYSRY